MTANLLKFNLAADVFREQIVSDLVISTRQYFIKIADSTAYDQFLDLFKAENIKNVLDNVLDGKADLLLLKSKNFQAYAFIKGKLDKAADDIRTGKNKALINRALTKAVENGSFSHFHELLNDRELSKQLSKRTLNQISSVKPFSYNCLAEVKQIKGFGKIVEKVDSFISALLDSVNVN